MAGKTKYKVGAVFNGTKRIVEYCGSHPTHRVSMWKWECLGCGTIHGPSMTSTLTRKDRAASLPRCCMVRSSTKGYEGLSGTKFGQVFRNRFRGKGETKRELEFTLTAEYLWKLFEAQGGKCIYTGRPLDINSGKASVDRINSHKGYIPGNVEWVHKDVNTAKMALYRSSFVSLCREVTENYIYPDLDVGQQIDDPAGPRYYDVDGGMLRVDGDEELFVPNEALNWRPWSEVFGEEE